MSKWLFNRKIHKTPTIPLKLNMLPPSEIRKLIGMSNEFPIILEAPRRCPITNDFLPRKNYTV